MPFMTFGVKGMERRKSTRIGTPAACLLLLACASCSQEARNVGPTVPQTRPRNGADPRIALYQANVDQVSQGGRYFAWYGCQACHGEGATGVRNLADGHWRHGGGFVQVFTSIADRHGTLRYAVRVPPEQLWQLTAYARDLPLHTPEKLHRQAVDQQAEPVGNGWSGPQ